MFIIQLLYTLNGGEQWAFSLEVLSINCAGGLYGTILTKVLKTDQPQRVLYSRVTSRFPRTDRASSFINKIFVTWLKQR